MHTRFRLIYRRKRRPRPARGASLRLSEHPVILVLLLGVGFALVGIAILSFRLSEVLPVVAVDMVNNEINHVVNRTAERVIQEELLGYEDIVTLERDAEGRVTSAVSNMATYNLLKSRMTTRILEEIEGLDLRTLDIPMGNLTGFDLFSGRGPSICVQSLWVGTVQTEVVHDFSTAGINQTLHRVMLHITVPAVILLPTGRVETSVSTQLCAAESIIVGSVPGTYIQLDP